MTFRDEEVEAAKSRLREISNIVDKRRDRMTEIHNELQEIQREITAYQAEVDAINDKFSIPPMVVMDIVKKKKNGEIH